jgi:hypothetical protein
MECQQIVLIGCLHGRVANTCCDAEKIEFFACKVNVKVDLLGESGELFRSNIASGSLSSPNWYCFLKHGLV